MHIGVFTSLIYLKPILSINKTIFPFFSFSFTDWKLGDHLNLDFDNSRLKTQLHCYVSTSLPIINILYVLSKRDLRFTSFFVAKSHMQWIGFKPGPKPPWLAESKSWHCDCRRINFFPESTLAHWTISR